ncbi:hypothetical protein NADFUDRAFT_53442 [Nadsonia fulvescens var. elongata DSM 6958]|uniref:Elongin-A n=1 Tax=Nadsonia fulvescens var. elongata DSM 6958 TaxID=857566 RepID=A0A1E3PCK8_9ASCO|nr:hypothetical protein NADFUDRAFT_53442 [Nadsonia fulvescens var. elongata DSM 6958]
MIPPEPFKAPSAVLPLTEFCLRTVLRFATSITDVGDTPFGLIEPLLRKVSASQLDEIERNSPHIRPYSETLWKTLVIRDFPDRPIPQLTTTSFSSLAASGKKQSYRALYRRYYKDKETHLKKVHDRLKSGFETLRAERSAKTITTLDVDPMAYRTAGSRGARGPRGFASGSLRSTYATPIGVKTIIDKAKDYVKSRSPMFKTAGYSVSSSGPASSYNLGGQIPTAVRQRLKLDNYDKIVSRQPTGRFGTNYIPAVRNQSERADIETATVPLSNTEAKRRREERLASRVAQKRPRTNSNSKVTELIRTPSVETRGITTNTTITATTTTAATTANPNIPAKTEISQVNPRTPAVFKLKKSSVFLPRRR